MSRSCLSSITIAMGNRANILVFTCVLTALPRNMSSLPESKPDRQGYDHAIACQVSSTRDGQVATLTCDFKRDVSNLTTQVLYYGWDLNKSGSVILDCYKNQSDRRCDEENPLYRHQGNAMHTVALSFVANKTTEGKYACQIPENEGHYPYQPCLFQLDSEATIQYDAIIGITTGVAVTLILVALFAMLFRRKFRKGERQGTSDNADSPRSGRAVNRRQPGGFHSIWTSCCRRTVNDISHDASLMTPITKDTSTAHQTPAQPCLDSGIDSFTYPSYIEKINYSDVSSPGKESMHTEPEVYSDNPLTSSAAQKLLRPYIDAMEKRRREMQGPTPSNPSNGSTEDVYELIEISNLDHDTHKTGAVTDETAASVENQRRRRRPSSLDHIKSPEAIPASLKATDWPPIHRLHDQQVWTERKLIPYVSCTEFPRTSQEANEQLTKLLMVQQSIQCRLDDLRKLSTGRCSFDVSLLQDVIVKLEYAEKQAATRQEALKELIKNLVKVEHVVQNYIDTVSRQTDS